MGLCEYPEFPGLVKTGCFIKGSFESLLKHTALSSAGLFYGRKVMKFLIKLGFVIWRRNHCGCRRVVQEHQPSLYRKVRFHAVLGIRRVLISCEHTPA